MATPASDSPLKIIPTPAEAARVITGGGIVKTPGDTPVGVDETYDVETDPTTGLLKPKTTGDMAAQSIEEQTRPLTFDEFKSRIVSGDIPTVAKIPQGNLQNDILLSDPNAQGITPENKQAAQERLENAFTMYSEQQPAITPVEFGQQTGEGQYVFAPTAEARANPELLTIQQNIFEGKADIARVVSDAFEGMTNPDGSQLSPSDQNIIERAFVRNLSTGKFWDSLVEKTYENAVVGSGVYLPDIAINYGWDAVKATAATGYSNIASFITGSDNSKEWIDEWNKTASEREKASRWWKGVAASKFNIKQLSQVMNEMVDMDLQRQLANGEIDQETYDRLTTQTYTTGEGDTVTIKSSYITEERAQALLNSSIDQLRNKEQYGLVLAEAALTMAGVGKMKAATGRKDLLAVETKLKELAERATKKDATDADIELFAKYKGMTTLEAGVAMKMEGLVKKFNNKGAMYALGVDRVSGNIRKILDERDVLSAQMRDKRNKGVNKLSSEYRELSTEYNRLTGMMIKTAVTGRFAPNLKENFVEAVPLSVFMYGMGENEATREFFGGDRLAAEGIGAVLYMGLGKPLVKVGGSAAYWVNQQGGDIVNSVLTGVENIANIPFSGIGPNGIKGFIADGNMANVRKLYKSRTGQDMPRKVETALTYVGRVSAALDDDGIDQVVTSMQKHQDRMARIVEAFPPAMRPEIEKVIAEDFARQSSIGFMNSANRLAKFSVDARDASSLKGMSEQLKYQRIMEAENGKVTDMIQRLREMTRNRTDIADPEEVENYILSLKAAQDATAEVINTEKAALSERISTFRKNILIDPNTEIPQGTLEGLDDIELELLAPDLVDDVAMIAKLDEQYARNTQLLATRMENISLYRRNDTKHLKLTARNLEMSMLERLKNMKRKAKRGFIKVDNMARKAGKTITMNKMITDLMEFAPEETGTLEAFFNKKSKFFTGALGRQMYTVANKMAVRSLEGLEGNSYDALRKLHTNPNSGEFFLGEDARPLDIMLFYMERGEGPEFKATPGEVMDVYSAFRDYAVRTGDDELAAMYDGYSRSVEKLIKDQAPDIHSEWVKAKAIYQTEWFDKLRVNGPLGKVHKSQNGPKKAVGKFEDTEGAETYLFEDIAIGEEFPEGAVISDRLFQLAYKNITPLEAFDPFTDSINKAVRGDDAAMTSIVKIRDQFIQEFSDIAYEGGVEFIFDLSSETGERDFNLVKNVLEEVVYAKWGKDAARQLQQRSSSLAAVQGGGYDWASIENLNEVQQALTVAVKVPDKVTGGTKTIRMKLVDLDDMLEQDTGIANILNRARSGDGDPSDIVILEDYKKYQNRVATQIEAVRSKVISDTNIQEDGEFLINQFVGKKNPRAFFEEFVVNGTAKSIDGLRDEILTRTGDSFTFKGRTYSTEEAFDRGMSYLIIRGIMDYGGLSPVQGKKSIGVNGQEHANMAMYTPQMVVDALDKDNVQSILGRYIDSDHQQFISDIAETLSEEMAYVSRQQDLEPTIDNIVRPMGTNQLISRAFNLARGMVSPQYVAAEFGVSLASQAGLDLMKLAAGNKEASDIILRMIKFPKTMTKADLDTFDNLVTDFVISELGQLGEEGRQYLDQLLELPEEEEDN
jgi:hypothetical protein